jgi:hypothetical protein
MIRTVRLISSRMKDIRLRFQIVTDCVEKINKPKQLYKAVKGDPVDELFARYINQLNSPVPINRLGNGKYSFGTKDILAKIMNGKLVIRVGGGYMAIDEFMRHYGNKELIKMQTIKNKLSGIDYSNDSVFSGDNYGSMLESNQIMDLNEMTKNID